LIFALALASCATAPRLPPEPIAFAPPPEQVPQPPVVVEAEPAAYRATGGDPDAVTNATLQLRSEYGDLWVRIRQGFTLADLDTREVKQAEAWYAARPDYVARMVDRGRRYLLPHRGRSREAWLPPEIARAHDRKRLQPDGPVRAAPRMWHHALDRQLYGLKQNWWSTSVRCRR
jgi:membrane-bound lytic murein transglycosylase D